MEARRSFGADARGDHVRATEFRVPVNSVHLDAQRDHAHDIAELLGVRTDRGADTT